MKKSKLGKVLTIFVIIAICLISFLGIFVKKQGQMTNLLPEYRLGMNLTGARVAKFIVSDDTQEIIYDTEGKVTTDGTKEDGSLKEGYTKETKAINSEDVLKEYNYKKVKKIMENRLNNMGIQEYDIRLNNSNGEILVKLPEDANTNKAIGNLAYLGKFEIKDSQTKEVLMNNEDVKQASAVYGSASTGTAVYLSIEFNKEGKQKLEDITKTYISSTDEEGNTVIKKISIELDGESMLENYFEETISTGILQLSIGSSSTSSKEISSYIEQANEVAGLIDSGVMPIQYELEENNYFSASIDSRITKVILGILLVLIAISFIYWMVRFHLNGIFSVISTFGLMAIILLVVRYANVVISIEAIVAVISVLVSNYMLLQAALTKFEKGQDKKTEIIKQTYKRYASILCPIAIIAVVFTFINWLPIASIGMILFWGMTILVIYDYVIMKLLLDCKEIKNRKENAI